MKSKNITTLVLEGTDGVGKSSLIGGLFEKFNYRYMIYHRGELSNLVYSFKYHRPFTTTQVGLPFLHILLTCDKKELTSRIIKRNDYVTQEDLIKEINKIYDQKEFIRLAKAMMNDYHMMIIDTTNKSIEEVIDEIFEKVNEYIHNLENDENISEWNKMYLESGNDLGLKFTCKDNQPYYNDIAFMSESTLHNGVYERFDDRTYPDNLIYSYNYHVSNEEISKVDKIYDFAYIINSKIKRRQEIYDYYNKIASNDKTCMISSSIPLADEKFIKVGRVFGDDFIKEIAKAKATVYCARDLAYLKLQTARLYEAILARQIVFVDKESDIDCDILNDIYKNDKDLIKLLYVTPETICENYDLIINNKELYNKILDIQTNWYNKLKETIKGGQF